MKTQRKSVAPAGRMVACGFGANLAIGLLLLPSAANAAQTDAADQAVKVEQLSAPGALQLRPLMRPEQFWSSPDGTRWAHVARQGSRLMMVVDGREVGPYSSISAVPIHEPVTEQLEKWNKNVGGAFTPDSERFVFAADKAGKPVLVVVDRIGVEELILPGSDWAHGSIMMPPAGHRYSASYSAPTPGTFGRAAGLIVDGKSGPEFKHIISDSVIFSRDGKHTAYFGQREVPGPGQHSIAKRTVHHLVIDTVAGPAYERQPRGNHFVETEAGPRALYFIDKTGGKWLPVFQSPDGTIQELRFEAAPESARISKDGKHWACYGSNSKAQAKVQAGKNQSFTIYLDGRQVATDECIFIQHFAISPEGSRTAFVSVRESAPQRAVIGGKPGLDYRDIGPFTFSPDGKRVAYLASAAGGGRFLVLDGKEHGPYRSVSTNIIFSSDSQQVAWVAQQDSYVTRVVLDGQPGPEISGTQVLWTGFHPGDNQLVYVTGKEDTYGGSDDKTVCYGATGNPNFPAATSPQVSQGGQHLAFVGRHWGLDTRSGRRTAHENPFFVFDSKKVPIVGPIETALHYAFSTDGRFVVATGRRGGLMRAEGHGGFSINGVEVAKMPEWVAGPAQLLPDGRAVAVGATEEGQLLRVTAKMEEVLSYGIAKSAADDATGHKTLYTHPGGYGGPQLAKDLVVDSDAIYGMAQGSKYEKFTVFRLNRDGSGLKALHTFIENNTDPLVPTSLVRSSDGWLYGTAASSRWPSPLFRLKPDGSDFAVLNPDEKATQYRLCTAGKDGSVYGAVERKDGVVAISSLIQVKPNGEVIVLTKTDTKPTRGSARMQKSEDDWKSKLSTFVDGGDGFFYGMSSEGPYRVRTDGSGLQLLHRFEGPPFDGKAGYRWQEHRPVLAGNKLVGIAEGGKHDEGVLYRVNRDGSGYQVVEHFEPRKPHLLKLLAAHGDAIYGTMKPTTRQEIVLASRQGGEIEQLHVFPRVFQIETVHLLPGGSAIYGVAGREIFRINLSNVAQPQLAQTVVPHQAGEPWRVQRLEIAKFEGTLPGLSASAVGATDSDPTSGQVAGSDNQTPTSANLYPVGSTLQLTLNGRIRNARVLQFYDAQRSWGLEIDSLYPGQPKQRTVLNEQQLRNAGARPLVAAQQQQQQQPSGSDAFNRQLDEADKTVKKLRGLFGR